MPLWTIFTKWPAPLGPAVQVAVLRRCPARPLAAGRARRRVDAGCERIEDRVEPLDGLVVAADHQAVAAVETEDAAARADVDVVDALAARAPRARRMSSR